MMPVDLTIIGGLFLEQFKFKFKRQSIYRIYEAFSYQLYAVLLDSISFRGIQDANINYYFDKLENENEKLQQKYKFLFQCTV